VEEDLLKLQKIRRKNSEKFSRKRIPGRRKKFRSSLKRSLDILLGRRILRSFGMRYAKPYHKDYSQKMDEAGISDDVIGFVDEMAVEANANTARLWSFAC